VILALWLYVFIYKEAISFSLSISLFVATCIWFSLFCTLSIYVGYIYIFLTAILLVFSDFSLVLDWCILNSLTWHVMIYLLVGSRTRIWSWSVSSRASSKCRVGCWCFPENVLFSLHWISMFWAISSSSNHTALLTQTPSSGITALLFLLLFRFAFDFYLGGVWYGVKKWGWIIRVIITKSNF
jgi:hypothetical protein